MDVYSSLNEEKKKVLYDVEFGQNTLGWGDSIVIFFHLVIHNRHFFLKSQLAGVLGNNFFAVSY